MFFDCHIFVQNRSVSLASGCWYVFVSLPLDRIFFRYFGKSCFVGIVLPFVDISLIFLLSPALSSLFPQVVLLFFFFHVLPIPFFLRLFQRLSFFIILACFRSFFYLRFQSNFPAPS